MNNINEFIDNNYEKAISLKTKFKCLENKEWDSLTVINELIIQVGHMFYVTNQDEEIYEDGREINNLGDELSDVLLQLQYLSHLENVTFDNLDEYEDYQYENKEGVIILLGQLSESLLEKYDYRFTKPRPGFDTVEDFIKDRIIKLMINTLCIATSNNIDMNKEFDKMIADASAFLERKTS